MQTKAPADGETVEVVDGVHLTQLAAGEDMSVQHFHIEPGTAVPAHSHHHEQAGFVVQGTLSFEVDDEPFVVGAGESFVVPSEAVHAVENRADVPASGVDIFNPPRLDPDWTD